jgi:signal transduction histidine kinase
MNETLLLVLGIGAIVAVVLLLRNPSARPSGRALPQTGRRVPGFLGGEGGARQVLERMSEGVLVVDRALRPEYANPAARDLLGLHGEALPPKIPGIEIAVAARKAALQGEASEAQVDLFYPRRLSLQIHASPLLDRDGAVLVLQDVTDEVRNQRMRREFVAHASHELKSPVASLQTLAEAGAQALKSGDTETAGRFSTKMLQELDRLSKLVGDLLDLSLLEEPGGRPDRMCDLDELVRKELGAAENAAADAGVALQQNPQGSISIIGDPQQLSLMVRNLVQNAIQYSQQGGHVTAGVRRSGSVAELTVSDTGIGIPFESQSRVFERFYRVDKARSRDRGGTGLGLSIVKHVVEMHGGEIELQSELGAGSTFTVRLPITQHDGTGMDGSDTARGSDDDEKEAV